MAKKIKQTFPDARQSNNTVESVDEALSQDQGSQIGLSEPHAALNNPDEAPIDGLASSLGASYELSKPPEVLEAPSQSPVLRITAVVDGGFWRCGRHFSKVPTLIPQSELSTAEFNRFMNENPRVLKVELI